VTLPVVPEMREALDAVDALLKKGARGVTAADLRQLQRDFAIAARDATDAAVKLYSLIRVAETEAELAGMGAKK